MVELIRVIQKVKDKYNNDQKSSEEEALLLNSIIRKIPIGIITWNEKGDMAIFNEEACRLLDVGPLKSLARFKKLRPAFAETSAKLISGGSAVYQYESGEISRKIYVSKSSMETGNGNFSSLIFHDLETEFGRLEMKSWDKLLNILTHEIANSVTAISSLSQSALNLIPEDADPDLKIALEGVDRRSIKLREFVRDYRSLTDMPKPKVEPIQLRQLLQELHDEWELQEPKIDITLTCPGNPKINADEGQLILCFENFFLNSVYALERVNDPKIEISAIPDPNQNIQIRFRDNGKGMEGDVSRALVPFFTTRENGKGIGLAMARQILRAHGGTLTVNQLNPGFEVFCRLPVN